MPNAAANARKATYVPQGENELVITRTFNAPRRLVFDAHTNPKHIVKWMLGPAGWTMPICDVDLRKGGKWHFVWKKEPGEEMAMNGEYREVDPPKRIVNTESWGPQYPETLNTTEFTESGGKTTMRLTILYPSKEARAQALKTGMAEGVDMSYDRLDTLLESIS